MERILHSRNESDTLALGREVGKRVRGGEIFILQSDLGTGKTVFAKGVAQGVGYEGLVSSPTFTLEHQYEGRVTILHYDLYRLGELGIVSEELQESLHDKTCVKIIEWPEVAHAILQDMPHIRITMTRVKSDESHRHIHLTCPEEYSYLFDAIRSEPA